MSYGSGTSAPPNNQDVDGTLSQLFQFKVLFGTAFPLDYNDIKLVKVLSMVFLESLSEVLSKVCETFLVILGVVLTFDWSNLGCSYSLYVEEHFLRL